MVKYLVIIVALSGVYNEILSLKP